MSRVWEERDVLPTKDGEQGEVAAQAGALLWRGYH